MESPGFCDVTENIEMRLDIILVTKNSLQTKTRRLCSVGTPINNNIPLSTE